VRIAAAATLEGRGDDSLARRYEAACAAELASEDAEVRARAVRDLAQRRSETSVKLLLPLLTDESEEVRLEVLRSMQFVRSDPALLDALRPLREDPSERVSSMASRIVKSLERGRGRPGMLER
jgi:HEAT repeat protein